MHGYIALSPNFGRRSNKLNFSPLSMPSYGQQLEDFIDKESDFYYDSGSSKANCAPFDVRTLYNMNISAHRRYVACSQAVEQNVSGVSLYFFDI